MVEKIEKPNKYDSAEELNDLIKRFKKESIQSAIFILLHFSLIAFVLWDTFGDKTSEYFVVLSGFIILFSLGFYGSTYGTRKNVNKIIKSITFDKEMVIIELFSFSSFARRSKKIINEVKVERRLLNARKVLNPFDEKPLAQLGHKMDSAIELSKLKKEPHYQKKVYLLLTDYFPQELDEYIDL